MTKDRLFSERSSKHPAFSGFRRYESGVFTGLVLVLSLRWRFGGWTQDLQLSSAWFTCRKEVIVG